MHAIWCFFLGSISFEKPLFLVMHFYLMKKASFTWLFATFLAAHNGKQPTTIYTDQDAAMGKAIKIVFT
jgi:zinc finger SWIM domain-containing protein 3